MSTSPLQDHLIAALTQQLVDLVKNATRFDPSSLVILAKSTQLVNVRGTQRHDVVIAVNHETGKGRLATGHIRVGDAGGLQRHIEASLAMTRERLPARFSAWVNAQPVLPGEPLVAAACFDGPAAAGYDHGCGACRGAGQVTCTPCSGHGSTTCNTCFGNGVVNCSNCHGTSRIDCSSCRGHGRVSKQVAVRRVNYADRREWTEYETVWDTCWSCGGRGDNPCFCGYGRQRCTPCSASGKVSCWSCRGSGQIECSSCAGTGLRHTVGWLTCTLKQDFQLHADIDSPEPKHVLESICRLEQLCALGRVHVVNHQIVGQTCWRTVAATLWLSSVWVSVPGQEIELVGYGDGAVVYDFKNVVERLLVGDLEVLEAALRAAPRLPWRPVAELHAATITFLSSEVNALIGTLAGSRRNEPEAFSSGNLRGSVSSDYVRRAAKAIRNSIVHAYAAAIMAPGLLLAGIVALALVVPTTPWRFYPKLSYAETCYPAFGCFAVGALFVELGARWRLKKRFSPELAPKVFKLLGVTHATPWAIAAMAVWAALVSLSLGALVDVVRDVDLIRFRGR